MNVLKKIWLSGLVITCSVQMIMAIESESYHQLNRSITQSHIIPRYQKLAHTTTQLKEIATKYCSSPNEQQLLLLKQAYHVAMDVWMGIQHIRFGPVNEDSRFFKIQFWPDNHGVIRKHLKRFLAKMEEGTVSEEKLHSGSVAIQGFPALEQLLFSSTSPLSKNQESKQHCQLVQWITTNLSQISQAILQEWQGEQGYQQIIETASQGNSLYLSDQEVSQEFLTSLQTGLQLIIDSKLSTPLGKTIKKARPKKTESWRSQRSLENIHVNLQALCELYQGQEDSGFHRLVQKENPELAKTLLNQFYRTLKTIPTIKLPLSEAMKDPTQRISITQLVQEVKQLLQTVEKQLSAAINIRIGFNALDGD